jgi:hypothetical protein
MAPLYGARAGHVGKKEEYVYVVIGREGKEGEMSSSGIQKETPSPDVCQSPKANNLKSFGVDTSTKPYLSIFKLERQ